MRRTFDPFRLLLISVAGWLGQQQRDAIDYLREENLVLREQLGNKRLRLNDDQRRRLAAKAKVQGIDKVVFDRNGFLYHGRVKAVADSCREHGLEF